MISKGLKKTRVKLNAKHPIGKYNFLIHCFWFSIKLTADIYIELKFQRLLDKQQGKPTRIYLWYMFKVYCCNEKHLSNFIKYKIIFPTNEPKIKWITRKKFRNNNQLVTLDLLACIKAIPWLLMCVLSAVSVVKVLKHTLQIRESQEKTSFSFAASGMKLLPSSSRYLFVSFILWIILRCFVKAGSTTKQWPHSWHWNVFLLVLCVAMCSLKAALSFDWKSHLPQTFPSMRGFLGGCGSVSWKAAKSMGCLARSKLCFIRRCSCRSSSLAEKNYKITFRYS